MGKIIHAMKLLVQKLMHATPVWSAKLAHCSIFHLSKWNLAKLREVPVSHPWVRAEILSHVEQKFFIILLWSYAVVSGFCKVVISQTSMKSSINPQ